MTGLRLAVAVFREPSGALNEAEFYSLAPPPRLSGSHIFFGNPDFIVALARLKKLPEFGN